MRLIKETDQRGILHSIASKNNEAEAMAFLRSSGLDEALSLSPDQLAAKESIHFRHSKTFEHRSDSIAFVDDQPFEREEVRRLFRKYPLWMQPSATPLLIALNATSPSRKKASTKSLV